MRDALIVEEGRTLDRDSIVEGKVTNGDFCAHIRKSNRVINELMTTLNEIRRLPDGDIGAAKLKAANALLNLYEG